MEAPCQGYGEDFNSILGGDVTYDSKFYTLELYIHYNLITIIV